MDEHFSKAHYVKQAITIANGATGTSAIQGTIFDAQGFSQVAVIVVLGPITAGAVTSFKVEQSVNSNMTSSEDIVGTSQTVADTDDDKVRICDIIRPTKRYVRLLVSRGTQAATVFALYIGWKADKKPVTQPAEVLTPELFKDAIGGTA